MLSKEICLTILDATNISKNNQKDKWFCSGFRIAFDWKSLRNFGKNFDRKFLIFGVDNNSSSRSDNYWNNILILDEVSTSDIKASFVHLK